MQLVLVIFKNIAYLDPDKLGDFEKICVNEPDICRDILDKESNFPLREVLEMELEKVEIPYFGADFWQKVPKAKT